MQFLQKWNRIHCPPFYCEQIQRFWSDLKNDILLILQINLSTIDCDIMYGYTPNDTTARVQNFIYMTAKTYIYKCTREKRLLSVCDYYCYIKAIYDDHEYNSKLQLEHQKFVKTWGRLQWFFCNSLN